MKTHNNYKLVRVAALQWLLVTPLVAGGRPAGAAPAPRSASGAASAGSERRCLEDIDCWSGEQCTSGRCEGPEDDEEDDQPRRKPRPAPVAPPPAPPPVVASPPPASPPPAVVETPPAPASVTPATAAPPAVLISPDPGEPLYVRGGSRTNLEAARGGRVRVEFAAGHLTGNLNAVGTDTLLLGTDGGELVLPLTMVDRVVRPTSPESGAVVASTASPPSVVPVAAPSDDTPLIGESSAPTSPEPAAPTETDLIYVRGASPLDLTVGQGERVAVELRSGALTGKLMRVSELALTLDVGGAEQTIPIHMVNRVNLLDKKVAVRKRPKPVATPPSAPPARAHRRTPPAADAPNAAKAAPAPSSRAERKRFGLSASGGTGTHSYAGKYLGGLRAALILAEYIELGFEYEYSASILADADMPVEINALMIRADMMKTEDTLIYINGLVGNIEFQGVGQDESGAAYGAGFGVLWRLAGPLYFGSELSLIGNDVKHFTTEDPETGEEGESSNLARILISLELRFLTEN